ncbi:tripartite tricarboxylate transporter substrate binding protein [Allopusillimonas soli]|uniref:Tripartite tricarboxylate transporter substrate binding protein n=1 Tax=Allopusillimonas soli TaxID=659016 RepID=A0A853F9K5_9BURK|nr:tripartite tricarboxylate transporter substrate binding protein [Allopusillimonas soli]NYT36478.1 tripartite tricarboxylate transporter substrate binding protein [Allopusillimonas soli]TEA74983.1 tripartite tricarboxylate transporter substrate binding protein [Allopusillimonas soli]
MNTKQIAGIAALSATLLLGQPAAHAQPYPSHAINLVVGAAPGGPTDAVARLLGKHMSKSMGVPVVVVNKGGGGGVIASEYVANQPADGYTLLMGSISTHGINTTLYRHLGYDAVKDFAPISEVVSYPLVLIVNPKTVPATTVKDFVAYVRKHADTLNRGSAGNGTSMHLAGELFNHVAGTNLNHVPYKGSAPAMQALLAGQIDIDFESMTVALSHIEAGSVRALGVTGTKRSPLLPDVPAIAETLPSYHFSGWLGLLAPDGTPEQAIDRIHAEAVKALANPEVRKKLEMQGMEAVGSSPAEFKAFIAEQIQSLGDIVRRSGATVD